MTSQQQSQMNTLRMDYLKQTQETRNLLMEKRAHQKTLISQNEPDVKAINANIDEMTALQEKLMKKKIQMRVDRNEILTPEQKVMAMGCGFGAGMKSRRDGMHARGKGYRAGGKSMRNAKHKGMRAPGGKKGMRGQAAQRGLRHDMIKLSDEQRGQMTNLRMEQIKTMQPMKNEMRELQVKQKNLLSVLEPDVKALMSNAGEIASLKNKMMKQGVAHRLQVRNVLTEDQRVLWDSRPHKRGMQGKGMMQGGQKRFRNR